MEPFVPEPDERIGHQSGSSTRNRSDGGGDSPTPPPRTPRTKSNILPLMGISVAFLALLLAVYFIQQNQIGDLQEQLENLGAAPGGTSPLPPDRNAPTLENQVAALSRLVDSQVIEIDRLKKQLASGASPTAPESPVPQVDNNAIDALRADLDALKEAANTKTPAVVTTAPPSDWQKQMEGILGSAVEMQNNVIASQLLKVASIESRVNADLTNFDQALNGQSDALASMLAQRVDPISQKLSAMESRLTGLSEIEQIQTRIGDYDQRLARLSSQFADSSTGGGSLDANQLEAALAPVLSEVRPLKSDLRALQQAVQQNQASIPLLERRVDTLAGDLAVTQNNVKPMRTELKTLDGNINKALTQLDKQQASMQQLQRSLEGAMAGPSDSGVSSVELATLKSQLDSHLNELKALRAKDDALARDLRASRSQLQSLQGDVASLEKSGGGVSVVSPPPSIDTSELKAEIANLNVKTDTILSRVKDSESNMKFWQSRIENQIAAQPKSVGGGGLSPVMEETIRLLKKQHPYTDFPDMD